MTTEPVGCVGPAQADPSRLHHLHAMQPACLFHPLCWNNMRNNASDNDWLGVDRPVQYLAQPFQTPAIVNSLPWWLSLFLKQSFTFSLVFDIGNIAVEPFCTCANILKEDAAGIFLKDFDTGRVNTIQECDKVGFARISELTQWISHQLPSGKQQDFDFF